MKKISKNEKKTRTINIIPGFCTAAAGSALIEMGNTKVLCAVSVDGRVPDHAVRRGEGWITADYTMLPYSTSPRTEREFLKRNSRSIEIKRLIGRSLRAMCDLQALAGFSITVDCDVLHADGGTRTAAITGGCVALAQCFKKLIREGDLKQNPLNTLVAAVSVGIVDDDYVLDLDFYHDSRARVDFNVVMNEHLQLIEVQGTAEKSPYSREDLNRMLDLAGDGISSILAVQKTVLAAI